MIVDQLLLRRAEPSADRPRTLPAGHESSLLAIGALLIDVAGVIYDDTCWWRWLTQLLSHAGTRVHHGTLREDWESAYVGHPDRGESAFWSALRRCLIQLGLSESWCDEIQISATARRRRWEAGLHAFPGITAVLAELAQRDFLIAAVADVSNSRRQLATRLRDLSISSHFDYLTASDDGDGSLLAPTFYQQLAVDLGRKSGEIAFVSNKPRHLASAHLAGMATIAVSCGGKIRADLCVGRLSAALCDLRAPGSRRAA